MHEDCFFPQVGKTCPVPTGPYAVLFKYLPMPIDTFRDWTPARECADNMTYTSEEVAGSAPTGRCTSFNAEGECAPDGTEEYINWHPIQVEGHDVSCHGGTGFGCYDAFVCIYGVCVCVRIS